MKSLRALLRLALISFLVSSSAYAQTCSSANLGSRIYQPVPTKPYTQAQAGTLLVEVHEEDEYECQGFFGLYFWLPTFQARYTIYGITGGRCSQILRGSIVPTQGVNPLCGLVGSISSMSHYIDPATNQPLIQREDCLSHPLYISYALPNGASIAVGSAVTTPTC